MTTDLNWLSLNFWVANKYNEENYFVIFNFFQVEGRMIKVYCHMMMSKSPKEYLTLNERENYSMIYGFQENFNNQLRIFGKIEFLRK